MTASQASLDSWLKSGRPKTTESHHPPTINNTIDMTSNGSSTVTDRHNPTEGQPSTYSSINDINNTIATSNFQNRSRASRHSSNRRRMTQQSLSPSGKPFSRPQALIQQSIVSERNSLPTFDQPWGHPIPTKDDNSFRIGLRNINTLPMQASNVKNDLLIQDIRQHDFDLFGITETNVAWQHLPLRDRCYDRFRHKLEFSKFITSNNKDPEYTEKQQSGGTMIVCHGHACARVMESGSDQSILGRWSWIRLRGSNGRTLRFATVYRPVQAEGAMSAYQQHRNVLIEKGVDTCPRQQLLEDLKEQISIWCAEGDQIIVAGDFNDDVRLGIIKSTFDSLGLVELILREHGNLAPNTYSEGRSPIDGIFGTQGIDVRFCGYTSGEWGAPSDHRALWLDIDLYSTFGGISAPLWKPRMRRLKLEDPICVQRFNQLRKRHMDQTQLQALQEEIQRSWNEEMGQYNPGVPLFEKLDRLRVQGILQADRRCRKLKVGNIPWSPEVQQCMRNISYLQSCKKKYCLGKLINSRTLKKSFSKTNLLKPVVSGNDAISSLKTQYNELNLLRTRAPQIRSSFLTELAEKKAAVGNSKVESVLKQMLLHEEQRKVARATKRVLKNTRNSVTAIEAQGPDGDWQIYTDKHTIEQDCMRENIERFTQASHLPILQHGTINELGWYAETQTSSDILSGDFMNITSTLDPSISRMLPYLSRPAHLKDICCDISQEQYIYEWSRSREFTSTGISQVHFGHFKASCQDNMLLELDRWMAETCLKKGHSLKRWHRGIDVMIPKKSNSLRANQLRTIVLLEADFNFLNKLMGKRIMQNAEKGHTVAAEQFGSRKSKSAINHAVNKQLALDIMRQEKRRFTLVILDAKGCYDRIAPTFASLALKRQGTPHSYVFMLFYTIQEMHHFIRTAYGDSRVSYHPQDVPFHGILQGNGAGPTIWAMVSSPLLDRLRDKGHGIKIDTPDGPIQLSGFAFVDDTDLCQDNEADIGIESTQAAVSDWDDALRATGGLLVPSKCKFFYVAYDWSNDQWTINKDIQDGFELHIMDDQGQTHPIQQVAATDSELALGIMFSPSGNMEGETTYLKQKATAWADKVRSGQLTRQEAWYCLNVTVLRTIEYALPATTLNYKQFQSVIQPILQIGLPRAGICRNISRDVLFSPIRYQGFGIRHPFISQGIAKLKLLFDTRQQLSLSLIATSWEHAMVESGLGTHFLQSNFSWFQCLVTAGWLTSLWEFLSSFHNISLSRVDSRYQAIMRHQEDNFLMAVVAEKGTDLTKSERITFNLCRLYLQVTLISDISTADGRSVRPHLWKGIKFDNAKGWWPKQPRPSEKAWRIWRRILKRILNTSDSGKFLYPFPQSNCADDWTWFLHVDSDRLYQRKGNGDWYKYSPTRGRIRTRNRIYGDQRTMEAPSWPLKAVTVHPSANGLIIDGYGTTINVFAGETPRWEQFIQLHETGDVKRLYEAVIQNQPLLIVSDGSAKDGRAAAAWFVTTDELYSEGIFVSGSAKVPGLSSDSHRAECFGILGGLMLIRSYASKWKMPAIELNCYFGCDNKSALGYAFNPTRKVVAQTPDFDVLIALRRMLAAMHLQPQWRHVKGHQIGSDLDIWARLNNAADELAGRTRLDSNIEFPPDNILISDEHWHVMADEEKITKNFDDLLYNACMKDTVKDVWHRYNRVNQTSFAKVAWEAVGAAMKESTIKERHWISKRAARDCGCNYVRCKRKERKDDGCPFCGEPETVIHVLKCHADTQQKTWEVELEALRIWLIQQSTDPDITDAIVHGLSGWRNAPEAYAFISTNELVGEQMEIGWDGFLEGCLGIHWQARQQNFFTNQQSRRSGHQWLIRVIRRLWKIPWTLWNNRNQMEHSQDQAQLILELQGIIQEQLTEGGQGINELEPWFTTEEIAKVVPIRDVPYAKMWLRSVRAARRRHQLRYGTRSELDRMRALMRSFLETG